MDLGELPPLPKKRALVCPLPQRRFTWLSKVRATDTSFHLDARMEASVSAMCPAPIFLISDGMRLKTTAAAAASKPRNFRALRASFPVSTKPCVSEPAAPTSAAIWTHSRNQAEPLPAATATTSSTPAANSPSSAKPAPRPLTDAVIIFRKVGHPCGNRGLLIHIDQCPRWSRHPAHCRGHSPRGLGQ